MAYSVTFTTGSRATSTASASIAAGITAPSLLSEITRKDSENMGVLSDLATYRTKLERVELYTLTSLANYDVANIAGSGIGLVLWMAVGGDNVYRNLMLRVYVDGEESPSINFDIGSLGLHNMGNGKFSTEHVGLNTNSNQKFTQFTLRFPIPFSSGLRVNVYNPTVTTGTVYSQLFYTTDVTSTRRLKSVNVPYASKATLTNAAPYTFATLTGAGNIVWHSMACDNTTTNKFMETDPQVYINGEGTASINTTGLEDWFFSGWYYNSTTEDSMWGYCTTINTTTHVMTAGVDLYALCGGLRFTNGAIVKLDTAEADAAFDLCHLLLYYTG